MLLYIKNIHDTIQQVLHPVDAPVYLWGITRISSLLTMGGRLVSVKGPEDSTTTL